MKVTAKVLATKIDGDKMLAKLQCNGKLPKTGDYVTLKWGKVRSTTQNALYWVLLQWYLDNGLQDHGYMTTDELHESLKGALLAREVIDRGGFRKTIIKSTTELTKDEFVDYMSKCEALIHEYLGISAEPFWAEYRDTYANV